MKIGFWNTRSRHSDHDWTDWEKYEVIGESKYFIKVRRFFIFHEWLPRNGLGMRLMEIKEIK